MWSRVVAEAEFPLEVAHRRGADAAEPVVVTVADAEGEGTEGMEGVEGMEGTEDVTVLVTVVVGVEVEAADVEGDVVSVPPPLYDLNMS